MLHFLCFVLLFISVHLSPPHDFVVACLQPHNWRPLFRVNQGDHITQVAWPKLRFTNCHFSSHYPRGAISLKVLAIGLSFKWSMGFLSWLQRASSVTSFLCDSGFGSLQSMATFPPEIRLHVPLPVPEFGMQ